MTVPKTSIIFMVKQRIIYLDVIRVIACLMVIAMHAPIPGFSAEVHSAFLVVNSYLMAPCVPLFFMVSGALLLPCKDGILATSYLKKRVGKIIGPTFFFSLFYMTLNSNTRNWVVSILSIPFCTQGHGVLWFMYTLTGLYLLVPIISPWLRRVSKREIEFYLMLWFVTLMYPYIALFLGVNRTNIGILYYFTGYAGYFLLGYYMNRYQLPLKWLIPITVLILPLPIIDKILGWDLDFYSVFWYLSASVAIMSATWFAVIKSLIEHITIKAFFSKVLMVVSDLSFGIYLIHIFVMRQLLWNCWIIQEVDNYYLQTLIIVLLVFMISFIVCLLISKLPLSQYFIGYTTKK